MTPNPGARPLVLVPDSAVESAISRLTAEFAGRVRPGTVRRIVRGCRGELAGTPAGALPELLERLARQRLLQAVPPRQAAGEPDPGSALAGAPGVRPSGRDHVRTGW